MKQSLQTAVAVKPAAASFEWVGVDVAKDVMDACVGIDDVLHAPQRRFERTRVGAKQLAQWCRKLHCADAADATTAAPCVAMESTGIYSRQLAQWLTAEGISCAIINPSFIKSYGQAIGSRNKTDSGDARIIAQFAAHRNPAVFQLPDPRLENIRELVAERGALVRTLTSMSNRNEDGSTNAVIIKLRRENEKHLKLAINKIEIALRKIINSDDQLRHDFKLLESIPGIGFVTIVTTFAQMGDLRRFANARKLSSFAGTSPRKAESGDKTVKRTRMSKMGNPALRCTLYMAAVSCTKTDSTLAHLYRKLVDKGRPKKLVLGILMRKLLVLMRAVLVSNTPYSNTYQNPDAPCGQTCGKSCGEKST